MKDYPSVGMISRIAQENNFIILFAVPQEYKQVYQVIQLGSETICMALEI